MLYFVVRVGAVFNYKYGPQNLTIPAIQIFFFFKYSPKITEVIYEKGIQRY